MRTIGPVGTMLVVLVPALALSEAVLGDPARLSTPGAAAAWLATTVLPVAAGLLALELALIMADPVSTRAGARLDRQLHALLHAGVQPLPADRRAGYLREWAGELHEILHGDAARPVTRLWHAFRFVVGIRRAATAIARSVEPAPSPGRRLRRAVRWLGRAGRDAAVTLALTPAVTAVFLLLVVLVASGMAAVAAGAALLALARTARGENPRATFPRAFTAGCRALGLSWFGWPIPDPDGTRTLLSFGRPPT